MKTQYTPGPWTVIMIGDEYTICPPSSEENNVAKIVSHGGKKHADAKLISAAPALLEALQKALKEFKSWDMITEEQALSDVLKEMKAAIKQATL